MVIELFKLPTGVQLLGCRSVLVSARRLSLGAAAVVLTLSACTDSEMLTESQTTTEPKSSDVASEFEVRAAATTYTAQNLGTLPGANHSFGRGINGAGHVVGFSKGRAFIWKPETGMQELPRLSNRGGATAEAINNGGDVAGSSHASDGKLHPVRWRSGVVSDLGTFPGANPQATSGSATDINRTGLIVGSISIAAGRTEAFLWENGAMRRLIPFDGRNSAANAINENRQIVGYLVGREGRRRGFIWQNGSMRGLGDLGGQSSEANGINDLGHVVGTSTNASGATRAFLWKDGVMTDIGDFTPHDINAKGQVVGQSRDRRAVVWENGVLTFLPDSFSDGSAYDINGPGLIAGENELDSDATPVRATRWVPSQ